MKTAKQIFAKQNKTAKELAEGIDILYSGQKVINEDVRALITKGIIDHAKQKCKEQMDKCVMACSANRHKTPIEIKEEIKKVLITELE